MKAMLVYQAGIANVFEVSSFNLANYGRDTKRLLQSDFRACVAFAAGLGAAGCVIRTACCNKAGDISEMLWSEDFDNNCPFSDSDSFVILSKN